MDDEQRQAMTPLAIDLYCGLGGWTEGLLAEGFRVVGFDIERHRYPARDFSLAEERGKGMAGKNHNGTTLINAAREQVHGFHTAPLTGGWHEYPAQLVLQDVLTIHGAQFKDAALIVASPPCQAYSYRAMPWKRAKALPPPDNSLFEACFRIQREASEAAGHHIPLVVENVCGAQKWVGRARWHFGSFYLWGDVPALMPITKRAKVGGFRFDGSGGSFQSAAVKVAGLNWSGSDKPGYKAQAFNTTAEQRLREEGVKAGDRNKARASGGHEWTTGFDKHTKNTGGSWFAVAHNTTIGHGQNPVHQRVHYEDVLKDEGVKGDDGGRERTHPNALGWRMPNTSSKSSARKAASAHIAKIPLVLARHIARSWYPV